MFSLFFGSWPRFAMDDFFKTLSEEQKVKLFQALDVFRFSPQGSKEVKTTETPAISTKRTKRSKGKEQELNKSKEQDSSTKIRDAETLTKGKETPNKSREQDSFNSSKESESPIKTGDSQIKEEEKEDAMDASKWRFHKAGGKKVKRDGTVTQRLECSWRNKTNCKVVVYQSSGANGTSIRSNGELHNHLPPEKPKIDPSVKQKALDSIREGESISSIQTQLISDAEQLKEEISPRTVPSKKQMYNWKYHDKTKTFPTNDSLQNIKLLYGENFVRKAEIHPEYRFILIADSAFECIKNSKNLFFDATFKISDDNFYLTTLMHSFRDLLVPVAFFIHSSKQTKEYRHFFNSLKKMFQLSPIQICADFDNSVREACAQVFPDVPISGDYFHFIQCHLKVLKEMKGQSFNEKLIDDMYSLYHAFNNYEFDQRLAEFSNEWSKLHSEFNHYFHNWLKTYPPNLWAIYAQPLIHSQSAASFEAWNKRLKSGFRSKTPSLDLIVRNLFFENVYYEKIMNYNNMYEEKLKEVLKEKSKKRKTSKANQKEEEEEEEDVTEKMNELPSPIQQMQSIEDSSRDSNEEFNI